jgi:hypothetical protein
LVEANYFAEDYDRSEFLATQGEYWLVWNYRFVGAGAEEGSVQERRQYQAGRCQLCEEFEEVMRIVGPVRFRSTHEHQHGFGLV